ncbi:MAG: 3-methyl-2-oxobutanoate hydroxymethyltransferase [Anaplasmataceae bacterium]|nr:3-methyl-2-oxobutanoate hydroxymethyltransferase [Anaplasmataceae bacterium]
MTEERVKASIPKFNEMKAKGDPVAWITAYDYPFSWVAEQAGVDMILVGDSGGMVQLGYETTNPVTMDEMIMMAKGARRGAPKTFIVGDMPQGSYEPSPRDAVINAMRFIKEAGSDAIKCEGGRRMINQVKAMVDAGIPVIGHLGLTPQSTTSFGGYRVQCKTRQSFEDTMEDALALQEAGVFAILLEAMPSEPAGQIARQLKIPIYGIGAGGEVDGQLVIMHDLTGFYQSFRPWFAKCTIPHVIHDFASHIKKLGDHESVRKAGRESRNDGLLTLAKLAVHFYVKEVKDKHFPGEDYSYPIKADVLAELKKSKYWK